MCDSNTVLNAPGGLEIELQIETHCRPPPSPPPAFYVHLYPHCKVCLDQRRGHTRTEKGCLSPWLQPMWGPETSMTSLPSLLLGPDPQCDLPRVHSDGAGVGGRAQGWRPLPARTSRPLEPHIAGRFASHRCRASPSWRSAPGCRGLRWAVKAPAGKPGS